MVPLFLFHFHPFHLFFFYLVRVLHLVKPLLAFIPEVAQADRKVGAIFFLFFSLFFPFVLHRGLGISSRATVASDNLHKEFVMGFG